MQPVIFGEMQILKKILPVLAFLAVLQGRAMAQEVQGVVLDQDTRQRITKVYLYNLTTHKGYYNNLKGEFSIPAKKGDTLVFALQGFRADTATVKDQSQLLVYLKRTSILLKEVRLVDSTLTPESVAKKNREEFADIYRKGNKSDLFTFGGVNGMRGAGLSIDALYSMFSREGKNARYLQKILEEDYREAIIDFRFTKSLVTNTTGLGQPELSDFMQQYRPAYYFVAGANDYALIAYIQDSYRKYRVNPKANRRTGLKQ